MRTLISSSRSLGSTFPCGFGSSISPFGAIEPSGLQSSCSPFTVPRTGGQLAAASSGTASQISRGLNSGFSSSQIRTFIQMRIVLKVVDNSGAKKVMCIQALKGRKGAKLGETIVVSVKEALPNGKAKKGNVYHAVVVRAAMQRGRCDGSEVKFDDNACVLIDKQGQPIGTRVFGPVPHELRKKNHVKILTLAQHIA
ncbi:hypothetical protein SAY86_004168 [Trapa natans]|uniref:50S ribosomal protein L14, chloroplastic n=1 Tax=Trapa natans TaxID=22666 RepID=A0AAN7N3C6_TRANT|nr:hypothetical protein SAY86_004168 [Trapa natans]